MMIDTDHHDAELSTFAVHSSFEEIVREAAREALRTPELMHPDRDFTETERRAMVAQLHDLRALLVRLLDEVEARGASA